MLSLFLKIFDVFRDHRRTKSDRHRQFLDDLLAFCADSEAAIAQFYLSRERDGDQPRSDATMAAFINLQKIDSAAQRLQLRARTVFTDSDLPRLLFELLRRISHSKQFLIIGEPAYLRDGYLADQQWVQYQVRRTITAAALEAGLDITDPSLPFIIGFHAATEYPPNDSDNTRESPSMGIMFAYNLKTVKAQWEAAGHKWDWKKMKTVWEESGHKWNPEWEQKG